MTLEGSEGCGKSTQVQRLHARLEKANRQVELTREPGGTALGEAIRHLLKHAPEGRGMVPEAELLLFAASRAQLVRKVIRPVLESGKDVLADRFLDSTVVYQGCARGLDEATVQSINAFVVEDCLPDTTFVLDMDAGKALERAQVRSNESGPKDRMEEEGLSFYESIREGFLRLAKESPERIVVIDADRTPEEVENEIWQTLTARHHGVFS